MSMTTTVIRQTRSNWRSLLPVVTVFYVCLICLFLRYNFTDSILERESDDYDDNLKETDHKKVKDSKPNKKEQSNYLKHNKDVPPELVFFLILCEAKGNQGGKPAQDISRQMRQGGVMLKSAVALSTTILRFIIIADSKSLYERFVSTTNTWPEEYKRRIIFEYHSVWYPPGREVMKGMFRVCATERLFIPPMFPKVDAAIYVDTDLVFLQPPEDLWKIFQNFKEEEVSAMAPCLYHYGTKKNMVPFYGKTGLNAGIMHMNLTRMNKFPDGGWVKANMKLYEKYKRTIKLADQDILNILFNKHPQLIHELGCEWNYRIFQCSQGTNLCINAAKEGASIIHGNALAFVNNEEMKLQVVFETWEDHVLGTPITDLLKVLKKRLLEVTTNKLPSKCANIPGVDDILTKQLERYTDYMYANTL